MKKPAGVTKEQWATYKGDLELALKVMNKALDVVADANFLAGEQVERDRIIKLLKTEIDLYGRDCWKDAVDLIKGDKR